jgi:hypothetical protein
MEIISSNPQKAKTEFKWENSLSFDDLNDKMIEAESQY